MKSLITVGFALLLVLGASRLYSASQLNQDPVSGGGPWQQGRCYRVFPSGDETFQLFKVLQSPSGDWVRVQSHPPSFPQALGTTPAAPVWLNARSVFAVQEWPCS
jgi:hypothetical protein